jgi:hypothetical protein
LVVLERGTREAPEKFGRFTRTVLSALDAGYGLSADVGKYRLYTPAPLQRQLDVVFGDQAALLGYRLDRAPGDLALFTAASLPAWNPWPLATTYPERLRVTLLWQARRQMGASYKVFVHLEDETGARRAQADAVPLSGVYPTSRWSVGETVRDYLDLDLPPGLPPGRYVLRIGLYDPATGRRLLRADGSNSLLLAGLPLGLADQGAVTASPAITRLADFEGGASLLGYDAGETQMRAGSTLSLTLIWQARTVVDRDYTVFVHLVGASASPVAQSDRQPLDGRYPTSIWNPGEVVVDVHTLAIPRDLRPGTYRLLVGLYHQPTNARAPTADGGDSVQIGEVRITSP